MTQICITMLFCSVLNGLIIGVFIMALLGKIEELRRLKEKYEKGK